MHDDKTRVQLVFNPRRMSVAMVEAELEKHPDLTIDQIKAMLAEEGGQVRPRAGVERALDARLLALAEEAIEAASEEMTAEPKDSNSDEMLSEGAPDAVAEAAIEAATKEMAESEDPFDEMSDDEIVRQPGETITEHVGRMAEAQGVDPVDEVEPQGMFGSQPVLLAAATLSHETNRAYCALLGDDSQPSWEDAPQWQKDSALAGVVAIHRDPTTTPEQSHEGWLAQKEADGWVYGEEKDPVTKTHPCMVPYGDLPEDQRLKDSLFGFVVRLILGLETEEGPEPESEEAPGEDQGYVAALALNTPVHVEMNNGEVHEGYYLRPQSGAMLRMRDGQDTIIFMPEGSFWASPSEDGSEDDGGD